MCNLYSLKRSHSNILFFFLAALILSPPPASLANYTIQSIDKIEFEQVENMEFLPDGRYIAVPKMTGISQCLSFALIITITIFGSGMSIKITNALDKGKLALKIVPQAALLVNIH